MYVCTQINVKKDIQCILNRIIPNYFFILYYINYKFLLFFNNILYEFLYLAGSSFCLFFNASHHLYHQDILCIYKLFCKYIKFSSILDIL